MGEISQEPVGVSSSLRDVRGLPIDEVALADSPALDDSLAGILRDLPEADENYAAFGQAP